ncbi:uncharacterized protein LOC119431375 [Dermacentor silvarum]|uniref:uncharacterized protein LOC119431375 n=1 Tax=Dermacentor silvarum TaxID=543639 RepID=UPI0018975BF4|nr:uncharacterized protein LOC119431375 [Dermacentor silvarum]
MRSKRSHLLFLQVGLFYRYKPTRTHEYSAPEPTWSLQRFVLVRAGVCLCAGAIDIFFRIRLLLAGDVEENPGPLSEKQERELMEAIRSLPKILAGQDKIIKQLETLRTEHKQIEDKIGNLTSKVAKLAEDLSVLSALEDRAEVQAQNNQLSKAMRNVLINQDELENRSRRNNLLFFGIDDENEKETWDESERKVISVCSDKLGITVQQSTIERAHRMGKHNNDKPRPIIVKFGLFKDKQRLLSAASKLKGSRISLSEDYSQQVRRCRSKLIAYARDQNSGARYKLKYNKMTYEGKTYIYDGTTDSVREYIQ